MCLMDSQKNMNEVSNAESQTLHLQCPCNWRIARGTSSGKRIHDLFYLIINTGVSVSILRPVCKSLHIPMVCMFYRSLTPVQNG